MSYIHSIFIKGLFTSKFQQIHHTNIISLEVLRLEGNCYVAFEYMAYSLYYITGNPLLDGIRLAAIVGQVRPPSVLTTNGVTHYGR
jgi:hypothetical protein